MSKYKAILCFLLIITICTLNYVSAASKQYPLISKVIYLDPGHGNADPGALYKGKYESDLNLEISIDIMEELKKEGATVYLTRYGDYDLSVTGTQNRKRSDLSRRANIINGSGCDMFISIHLNADSNTTYYGAQVYYDSINKENEKIAKIMQEEFQKNTNTTRKYQNNNTKYMQRRINRPGVLLEAGFLSNPSEGYLLTQDFYQHKIAQIVKKSVIQYFKEN